MPSVRLDIAESAAVGKEREAPRLLEIPAGEIVREGGASMKDAILVLVEAVRLARLEVECYRDPRCRASAEWTVNRLDELLAGKDVSEAMRLLAPDTAGPSIVPDSAVKARQFLQP